MMALAMLLDGLSQGLLLFMLSAGLTLVFGLMGVLNLAHASFYMLGAYVSHTVTLRLGFWPALLVAPVLTGLFGAAVERFGLRPLRTTHHDHVAELLFTFGLSLVIVEVVQLVWGRSNVTVPLPRLLQGVVVWGDARLAVLRLFAMGVSLAMLLLLALFLAVSRQGLVLRAALNQRDIIQTLGHDVPGLFTTVFGLGAALAAMAGVIGGQLYVTEPAMATEFGSLAFVVVIVGGLGSLRGAFVASLCIGLLQSVAAGSDASALDWLGRHGIHPTPGSLLSELAALSPAQCVGLLPYLLLPLVLSFRPRGLMGRRDG